MWVLFQKLHILLYDWQNLPGDPPPSETPAPLSKVEVLKPPLSGSVILFTGLFEYIFF